MQMNNRLFIGKPAFPGSSIVVTPENSAALDTGSKDPFAALRKADLIDSALVSALAGIVGADHVHADFDTRLQYVRDSLPYAKYHVRSGLLPATLPSLVVRPANTEEVAQVLALSRTLGFRIVPVGSLSGVLGGALPLAKEVMLDVTRMNRLIELNTTDGIAVVQAGMNGGAFEEALNAQGWTCGHYPQSLLISTVGGWAACRGGGQASSRYGKAEDIVTGLEVVVPEGKVIRVRAEARRAVGPSIKDIFVGSEGVLGVITELTLRVWRLPEVDEGLACAFPTLDAALNAARRIMQAELRPAIVRLYDAAETASRTKGIELFERNPFMGFLAFSGSRALAEVEQRLALAIVAEEGGIVAPSEPYLSWRKDRYVSASAQWTEAGYFMDTIEVTAPWSRIPAMYEAMRKAALSVHPDLHFGSHWSHVYADGACQYMTFRLPPMPDEQALPLHGRLWDLLQEATLAHGGSISHHHGAGVFRNRWMRKELGAGLDLLQQLKDAVDPDNLVNPGKLGLRSAPGAVEINAA